jgi:hypothetical protein
MYMYMYISYVCLQIGWMIDSLQIDGSAFTAQFRRLTKPVPVISNSPFAFSFGHNGLWLSEGIRDYDWSVQDLLPCA